MKTCKQYREQAWNALQNNGGDAIVTALLIFLLSVVFVLPSSLVNVFAPEAYFAVMITSLLSFGSVLVVAPLTYSFQNTLLNMVRTSAAPTLNTTFNNFKNKWGNFTASYFLLYLLLAAPMFLLLFAFAILFFIINMVGSLDNFGLILGLTLTPIYVVFLTYAIIISLMYSMIPFVLHDNPNIGITAAFRTSRELMRGHKVELFKLYLSFIGWILLCVITVGVACLWVQPYMYTAIAAFYEDIREPQVEGAI